jgi:hypothetical protein
MDELRECPFCGEIHRVTQVGECIGYDDQTGAAIPGNYKPHVALDCVPDRRNTWIPLELYNTRPAEDRLPRELAEARAERDALRAAAAGALAALTQPKTYQTDIDAAVMWLSRAVLTGDK